MRSKFIKFVAMRRHVRYYALAVCMFMLISTVLVSANLSFKTSHSEEVTKKENVPCSPTIPTSDLYLSHDGKTFNYFGPSEKAESKEFPSMIAKNNGIVYAVIPPSTPSISPRTDGTYIVSNSPPTSSNDAPYLSSQNLSCITGFDFFDIAGKGVKQWVLQYDLKHIITTIVTSSVTTLTILSIPIDTINELFGEFTAKIQEMSFPPILVRRCARNHRPSLFTTDPIFESNSQVYWLIFRQQTENSKLVKDNLFFTKPI